MRCSMLSSTEVTLARNAPGLVSPQRIVRSPHVACLLHLASEARHSTTTLSAESPP